MSFFPFLFFFFVLSLVLVCVVLLGCKSGRDGRVRKVGRVRGWQGEVVYYWQNGGVAIWRKRERSSSKQIKQTRKTHSYRQTRLAATKQCPLDNKSDVGAKKKGI